MMVQRILHGDICDKYSSENENVKVIHKENEGVSKARNTGIDESCGNYIGFMDADDFACENMYEVLINNIKKYDADISMVSPVIEYLDGRKRYFNNTKKLFIWSNEEALENFFKGNVFNMAVYTKIFKREIIKNIRFDENRTIHEDKYFTFLALKDANKIVFEDISLYRYIKRENSISTSKFSKKKFDAIYFADKIYECVRNSFGKNLEQLSYVDRLNIYLRIYHGLCADKDARIEYEKEMKDLRSEISSTELKKYKISTKKRIEVILLRISVDLYRLFFRIFYSKKRKGI